MSGWKLLLQYENKVNGHSHTDSFNSISIHVTVFTFREYVYLEEVCR